MRDAGVSRRGAQPGAGVPAGGPAAGGVPAGRADAGGRLSRAHARTDARAPDARPFARSDARRGGVAMSANRLLAVFGRDFSHNARRVLFWVWIALLVFFAWSLSTGKVRIQSGDSGVGGTKAYVTSEFAVAQLLMILT